MGWGNGKRDGYLKITQNKKCKQMEGIGILFGAAYRAFTDIAEEYPGNIEIDLAGEGGLGMKPLNST